jgi:hypothetical protein
MSAVLQHMRAIGCHVGLLVTDIDNWYRYLGWERAGSKRSYRVDRGNVSLLPALPPRVTLQAAGYERAVDLLRLRDSDRLGALRTAALLPMQLTSRKSPSLFFAESDGSALAYLLVRESTIIEWGGAADVVLGLVRAYFERADRMDVSTSLRGADFKAVRLQCISVVTPAQGHAVMGLLDDLRMPYSLDYCGMLRIVDPVRLLDAYGVIGITVSEREGSYTVSDGRSSAILSPNLLTKLFLGPERVCDIGPDVFPLPFWQWTVDTM